MTLPAYKLPAYPPTETLIQELTFGDFVPGASHLTFVAGPISKPFKIVKATMVFADTALWNMRYYFLVSTNPNVSTTGVPPDENIFGLWAPQAYFIGNNAIREALTGYRVTEAKRYVKFHVQNLNAGAVPASASVFIMLME